MLQKKDNNEYDFNYKTQLVPKKNYKTHLVYFFFITINFLYTRFNFK
jgi:hypothetical protein